MVAQHMLRGSARAPATQKPSFVTFHKPILLAVRQQRRGPHMASQADAVPSAQEAALNWQEYNQRWVNIWNGGLQKGQLFDKGQCTPQLLQLISSGALQVQGRKVLVPGCGRGYDVFAFASAGAAVSVGLDLCPEAIAAAQAEQQQALSDNPAASAAVHLVAGDFFQHSSSPDYKGPFDIGYDYTFLCALHPDMRRDWAAAWASLLAPGGQLLTMVYPVDSSRPQQGPPWPVTPELYKELLIPAGFELASLEPIPHHLSLDNRKGKEWLGRWIWKQASGAGTQC